MVPLPLEPQGGGDAALALTGERTVPGIASENYWFFSTRSGDLRRNPQMPGDLGR